MCAGKVEVKLATSARGRGGGERNAHWKLERNWVPRAKNQKMLLLFGIDAHFGGINLKEIIQEKKKILDSKTCSLLPYTYKHRQLETTKCSKPGDMSKY